MAYNNQFTEAFKHNFDFNQYFATLRRNFETLSAANQVLLEGAQAVTRRYAEVARDNSENVLKASKESLTGASTPENCLAKHAELSKSLFENTLSNLREITEMATKSSFEAFDLLNRRAAESMEELSAASTKTADYSKKKAA